MLDGSGSVMRSRRGTEPGAQQAESRALENDKHESKRRTV